MPPRDRRDINLDLDELIETVEDHDLRITPLEAWHAAVVEARRLWGNRLWVFGAGITGTVVAGVILKLVTGGK